MLSPPVLQARAAAAALCAALVIAGCTAKAPAPRQSAAAAAAPTTPTAPPVSVEEIAAAAGCTAELDVQAEELREGGCRTAQGAYRMLTFATDGGMRSWLAEARMYGGTYLVGTRWVVTGPSPEALAPLRSRLGGDLDADSAHHAGH